MSAPARLSGLEASITRIGAVVMRYILVMKGSWPRLAELAYWPTVQMIIWGFVSNFFETHSSWVASAAGILIGAVLLWDTLFRANLGVSVSFLEEVWSRHLANLFISPLRPYELAAALVTTSFVRTLVGVLPAMALAIPLYHFSIFEMGFALVAYFSLLLIMGWSIGLFVSGVVMRYGLSAESLAWLLVFAFAPLSCIYYPIDSLPEWVQWIAVMTPSAHVFEGMRAVLQEGVFHWDLFLKALALDMVYICFAGLAFMGFFAAARDRGLLLQQGE
ncbi:MAG: ABC transporter permease [Alphaproteobacteria bacterium]|nr:ABC transporter permease [Alphaproteobacteria bacterium]